MLVHTEKRIVPESTGSLVQSQGNKPRILDSPYSQVPVPDDPY